MEVKTVISGEQWQTAARKLKEDWPIYLEKKRSLCPERCKHLTTQTLRHPFPNFHRWRVQKVRNLAEIFGPSPPWVAHVWKWSNVREI